MKKKFVVYSLSKFTPKILYTKLALYKIPYYNMKIYVRNEIIAIDKKKFAYAPLQKMVHPVSMKNSMQNILLLHYTVIIRVKSTARVIFAPCALKKNPYFYPSISFVYIVCLQRV